MDHHIEKPFVSVWMITYNHEPYIAQAIEGVLMQKTDFPIELVIGEDCSSDRTRDICLEYQRKHPEVIHLLLNEKNIGMTPNFIQTLKACQGKYIAFCEGDDFWTDADKLQKQIDYLERTPKANGCFHDVCNVDHLSKVIRDNYYSPSKYIFSQKECLTILGSSYATCSLVCRSEIFQEPLPIWFQKRACDEFLDLLITQHDKELHYLENCKKAAYRIHDGGIWQGNNSYWRKKEILSRKLLLVSDKLFYQKYSTFLDNSVENSYRSLFADRDIPFSKGISYGLKYLSVNKVSLRKIYHFIRITIVRFVFFPKRAIN